MKATKKDFEKAINHIKGCQPFSEARIESAWEIIEQARCPITMASPRIADEIASLMDEYGQDHDFEDGWWFDFGDEDDIFTKL